MASDASLTCNFTITSDLGIGVSFRSDDNGADYGGLITIYTPGTSGPVTTGLWDSDGNVYFTLYDTENPALNCVINSGSTPGSWNPYVTIAQESGLTCTITGPEQTGESTYSYTLAVAAAPTVAAKASSVAEAAVTAEASPAQQTATLALPPGGMEAWTQIMQGGTPVPDQINTGSPIVMAWTRFDDGTQVAGGVYKSDTPTELNVKFMWVLDANGNQYPGWPIDVSDDEDFLTKAYSFSLPGGAEDSYLLNIADS